MQCKTKTGIAFIVKICVHIWQHLAVIFSGSSAWPQTYLIIQYWKRATCMITVNICIAIPYHLRVFFCQEVYNVSEDISTFSWTSVLILLWIYFIKYLIILEYLIWQDTTVLRNMGGSYQKIYILKVEQFKALVFTAPKLVAPSVYIGSCSYYTES